ncbi:MAG: ribosome small subunit-dependent GTPase A [Cyanobacteria bacterium K_DeepCast_35m_m2_023]|nr:ribosome small subunit-dependent GTPase A [Cyanobacteria bacterium K_DeepCast_35m_m2_023]
MVEPPRRARVVSLLANFCWVVLDQPGPAGQRRLLCTRRTRLGKSGQAIHVGDWVQVDVIDWPAARAAVSVLEPRCLLLERPPVANITRVVVVVALVEPALDPLQLTRFLITAELSGAIVELVFSKADLLPAQAVEHWLERARGWGYAPLAVSRATGQGVPALQQRLSQPGLAVLCGPSGVGKSSLINALMPDLDLRVAAVSGRLQRGRHTTRHVELFELADGALLADTPGFNRPALPLEPQSLVACFPELRSQLSLEACQFADCLHQGEPGCAMGSQWDRQSWYSQCLQELLSAKRRLAPSLRQDDGGSLRQRGDRLEPRLAAQYRQPSRRRQRQAAEAELTLPDQED